MMIYFFGEFSHIIDQIEDSVKPVTIKRRNKVVATIVGPKSHWTRVSEEVNCQNELAKMFIQKLFPENTPIHLKGSQLSEFKKLSLNKLLPLIRIESLPIDPKKRSQIVKSIGARTIERLEKRYEIAKSIAEEQGLYDIMEDATGKIDLS